MMKFVFLMICFILIVGCSQPGEKEEIIIGDVDKPPTEEKQTK
ncbi:hypothetical protein [Pseudalkalibacillus berkeleyi]|nr:hypothetical protein [Pseudalkalibacillus berkeleyi]